MLKNELMKTGYIEQKINNIENTMKSLMNKNTVVYSNHSKTSDTLHTHTVCAPYYKAAPYNISHT